MAAPGFDFAIPAPALGAIALTGLVVLSLVGCYAYYPSPSEIFKEMYIIRGEVLTAASSGNKKHAGHFIPIWDDWTRRLQVGAFLREGSNRPYRRMKTKVFRDRLEFLKHAVEEGDREECNEYIQAVEPGVQADARCLPRDPGNRGTTLMVRATRVRGDRYGTKAGIR